MLIILRELKDQNEVLAAVDTVAKFKEAGYSLCVTSETNLCYDAAPGMHNIQNAFLFGSIFQANLNIIDLQNSINNETHS